MASKLILTGEDLQHALDATTSLVSLCTQYRFVKFLKVEEVLQYLGRPGYRFEGTRNRVRRVRQIDPKAVRPWSAAFEPCWRNQKAAVLWPFVDSPASPL